MIDPTPDEQQRAKQQKDGENAQGRETERPIRRGSGIADMPRADRKDDSRMPEDPPPGNKVHGDKLGDIRPGKERQSEG